ncbi:MAG: cupin domain-containing protein [Minwuia sp.]|uniref:cupin domain-containing protein n=1 Tax=Minwuia sp. TaxID=2493630 RepID=UPI003A88428F
MLHQIRRIITTNDANGRSRILSDAPTPHTIESAPNRGLINIWGIDGAPPDMTDTDGAKHVTRLSPPDGGSAFRFFQLPPRNPDGDKAAAEVEAAKAFAAMGDPEARVDTSRHPNMHRTISIDYIILLKGRVKLILDDDEAVLEPFDVVIQRETNHAWENLSDEPALLIAVLMDTHGAKGSLS